jgi:hypothetical protein
MIALEEYCIQVIETLKACRDPAQVRDLLSEVDGVLTSSRIGRHTRTTFWKAVSDDLDVVAQESPLLLEKQAATALSAVIAAAQTVIAQYQLLTAGDQKYPGS